MSTAQYKSKKPYTLIAILAFVVLSSLKCEKFPLVDRFYSIAVQNCTSDTIYSDLGLKPFLQYPDTTLPTVKPVLMHIRPQSSFNLYSRKPYEEVIANLPADTLSIYIFSKSVYKDTLWSNVHGRYLVLKRYDFSLEDLKKLNWEVVYPPTPEMKDIKQYPAYGQ